MLQRLGEEHERRYVDSLRARGLTVVDGSVATKTVEAMRQGADAIVQARLEHANLAGYADVLHRVERPSDLGAWSYEVQDTKLARDTKGGTILQLSAYSALLGELQGRVPEQFQVVTPDPLTPLQTYRVEDYAAYYRMVLGALREATELGHETLLAMHYPEPVDACSVCRWEARCIARRRADDHTSFIANAGRMHRVELTKHGYTTLAATASMPVPVTFRPSRGAGQAYDRLGHQARVQQQQRQAHRPIHETLPVVTGEGLCRLPEPSSGDLFLDLESARFARDGGREYVFGVWGHVGDRLSLPMPVYTTVWATNDADERAAFEQVVDLIMDAWARDPRMHVYHFNHHEPTAFKKLMGRYATRAEALDQLLRAERFVDLYPITRQALRAGVESYSIKKLEPFTAYTRAFPLTAVHHARMAIELALESGTTAAITDELRGLVTGYNQDDCRSTEALRDWLESLRCAAIASGIDVPRPESKTGDPSARISDLQRRAAALRSRLLDGLSSGASERAHPDHPRWLLAYLVDFHKREENAEWWEYFRLLDLPEDELLDEAKAIVGLTYVGQVEVVVHKTTGKPTGSIVDRYRYPSQDVDVRRGTSLKLQNQVHYGSVVAHDRAARTIDIKKGVDAASLHAGTVFSSDVISTAVLQEAVMRLAAHVPDGCGLDLLNRRPPVLRSGTLQQGPDEPMTALALRVVADLDKTTLAIQGPPGAGKTYTGAQMIRALVTSGKRVGVTAGSHKVIRNLLRELRTHTQDAGEVVRLGHKVGDEPAAVGSEPNDGVREFTDNDTPRDALRAREVDVLGGTPFLWARQEYANSVDVLFVDEAGQMSLGNALAVSHAAESLVLLGDPQQLEQPLKASHPEGVGVSALQHVLGDHETMPGDRGLFLPTTWRMSPTLCAFSSEQFYERKLESRSGLEAQVLRGTRGLDGSHLWLAPVDHDGNQSVSDEEVEVVAGLVDQLLQPTAAWVDADGTAHAMTAQDIRVVAPFNAQVNRLTERLGALGVPVGTVDKFQGQTAAVVIYSMTTSRPEDAPRGMEFLCSLNRLNVATSRARCAVFLVASPRLFEPDCRTPRQMRLANALCRYRELACTAC